MSRAMQDWTASRGYLTAWTDAAAVDEVRLEFERRRTRGELNELLYQRNLAGFTYLDNKEAPNASTVLIVSVPRPAHTVTFDTGGRVVEAIVPPTYRWYRRTYEEVKRDLERVLPSGVSGAANLSAPLKALAARVGLVKYGRNNVTYAPGFGSYHQLMAYLLDADLGPAADPTVDATQPLPECEHCRACAGACPTGAIRSDRFMLDAERCLTLHSEEPSSHPWPEWLRSSEHNSLVGCMLCQRACPQNAGLLRVEPSGASFDEAETRTILGYAGDRSGPSWDAIRAKLEAAGLVGFDEVVSRNLRALVARP